MNDPFELVREWFAAFNRSDLTALEGYYADAATLEQDGEHVEGRGDIRGKWRSRFAAWAPAFDGGARRRVRMIGRIETGLIHVEWLEREDDGGGIVRERRGYSDFRVERGAIVAQRDVLLEGTAEADATAAAVALPPRRYPPRPVVGVGGVIIDDGRVVLIRRKYEPLAGQWSLPGGTLELGESLEAGVAREMREETGLEVEVGAVVDVFDRILLDAERRVQYHFVLVDYLCRPVGGVLQAGSDVDDAVWVRPEALTEYHITPKATSVIVRALAMAAEGFG